MGTNILAPRPLNPQKISHPFFSEIKNIPDEPKISIENYLLDLVSESDGKESSLYLKGIEKFIQKIWQEMVHGNWRELKIVIPETLNIHPMSFYAYKNGRKAISIQMMYKLLLLWKIYCQKSNKDVEKIWNEIYKSDYTFSIHKGSGPTKLPRWLSPKLFYLIGFICGDGHLTDYGNHYLLKISEKSIEQLNYVLKPIFGQLFNVKFPFFQIYKGGHALQVGNKAIFRFLTQVLKVKVGVIPGLVKSLDPVNKKYFLIGILDSEGSIDSSYLDSRIVIHQGSFKFLEEVIDLFEDINIRFTGPYRHETKLGIWYHIQVRKKADILKFIKEVGSHHIDKFQKIKILEKKLYAHGYNYNTT